MLTLESCKRLPFFFFFFATPVGKLRWLLLGMIISGSKRCLWVRYLKDANKLCFFFKRDRSKKSMDGSRSWIQASSASWARSCLKGDGSRCPGSCVIKTALEESPAAVSAFLFSFPYFQRPKITEGRREKSLSETEQEFLNCKLS